MIFTNFVKKVNSKRYVIKKSCYCFEQGCTECKNIRADILYSIFIHAVRIIGQAQFINGPLIQYQPVNIYITTRLCEYVHACLYCVELC